MAPVNSVPGFRELGGLPLEPGRRVRHGRLYRAGGLSVVSEADRRALASLGIGTVIDLRSEVERHQNPSLWGQVCGAKVLECDVNGDVRAGRGDLLQLLRAMPNGEGARRMMSLTYRHFGAAFAPRLAGIFEALLNSEQAVLIHCTAGKDRTGFACALILHALGADAAVIHADYGRSREHIYPAETFEATAGMLTAYLGAPPAAEVVQAVLGIEAEFLEAALKGVAEDFGSLDAYLESVGGLDGRHQARLQAAFSEAALG